ncbi:hypothetical protein CI102_14501 [Trichoderma harzianum]|nr:hypothetical protein CI102_14501 [Trichoderma harzianum]
MLVCDLSASYSFESWDFLSLHQAELVSRPLLFSSMSVALFTIGLAYSSINQAGDIDAAPTVINNKDGERAVHSLVYTYSN